MQGISARGYVQLPLPKLPVTEFEYTCRLLELIRSLSFCTTMDEVNYQTRRRLFLQRIHHCVTLFVAILFTSTSSLFLSFFEREPYHTSILTGEGWVTELLNGHPERIRCELGVRRHVFLELIQELQQLGYTRSRFVSLEEQLAIFLYTSVTGLTIRHVGERFQRSNETISR
jgi:hypothetical protein